MFRALSSAVIAIAFTGGLSSIASAATHTPNAETVASVTTREHVSTSQLTRSNDSDGSSQVRVGTVLGLDRDLNSNPSAGSDAAMWGETAGAGVVGVGSPPASSSSDASLHRLANRILGRTSSIAVSLTKNAMQFIGTPYVFGGTQPGGFDCSGYTQYVFAKVGINLPRTADVQYAAGASIKGDLIAGDLVFFQTYEPGASHVGIYLGNGNFIHSSSHGVRISALSESYWANRYVGAKRFIKQTPAN